jgi:hypothetical protein
VKLPIVALLTRFLGGLRYPWLFAITAAVFLVDLVVPDLVPLADELLLGLATLLLASRRRTPGDGDPPRPAS